jgi:GT2 family glycosyltransferase
MGPLAEKASLDDIPGRRCAPVAVDSVAVIVVNYNSGEHLRKCIQSIAGQTQAPTRVVVVDNGSSDDSLSGIDCLGVHVEIIKTERNLGFAAANNLAVRHVRECRYVALVNADAYVAPTWLERLMDAARRYPECHFFASQLVSAADPMKWDGTGDVYHTSGRAWRRDWGQVINADGASATPILGACAAAAIYSREAFLAVEGFDEDYFCFYEDVDLSFRLQLAGHRGLYVPEAIARHVGSATTIRRSDFSVYHAHRNLVWTYVKNMPGPLFWLYLPQHLALNLGTIAWFTLRGRGRVIFRAKWDALTGLARAWRKRRLIQSRRRATVRYIGALLARGFVSAWRGR